MALRTRDKESQKHPGKPDLPRRRRSTISVQAEKADKSRAQNEKEATRTLTIQAAADLETEMVEKEKEKLANAHRPNPSTQKKVSRPLSVKLIVREKEAAIGKKFLWKGISLTTHPDKPSEDPEGAIPDEASSDSDREYNPNEEVGVESEDDDHSGQGVLDDSESGEELTNGGKRKKKYSQGSLRAAVHAAQGKTVQKDGHSKRKASESVEAW